MIMLACHDNCVTLLVMKKLKIVLDKLAGFKYTVLKTTKTHFVCVDHMGESVSINKTQAFVVKEDELLQKSAHTFIVKR